MSGFVALHRDAFEHHLLKDGERFRAWFWMVSKACWKDTKHDSRGKTITLRRGQFATTIRQLADELKWSKGAVERFLTRLETETMIETKSGTGKTIITICNYSKYQDRGEEGGTETGTKIGTKAGQKRDTKEQGNKGTSNPNGLQPENVSDEVWSDFVQHRRRKKAIITERVIASIVKEAALAGWTLDAAFAEIVTRNWQTFKADWVEKRQEQSHPAARSMSEAEWLAKCEAKVKWAREEGLTMVAREWEGKAAEVRARMGFKLPDLKVVS